MLLTVPDRGLADLISTQSALLQTWHDAARDVMMLIHILKNTAPTLADVLAVGLVVLAAPATRSVLDLRLRRAALTAIAQREDGTEVATPQDSLNVITRLEVRDVHIIDSAIPLRATP